MEAEWARGHLSIEEQAAPHLIDAEVLGVLRRDLMRSHIDEKLGSLVVEDLRDWPGDRVSHQGLLDRAWHLRANLRPADARYVALAEAVRRLH